MKIKFYIIGLLLIIVGFISFSSIAILNRNPEMNFTIHILMLTIGLVLIFLGIISMIIFTKEKKNKNSN